MGRCSGLVGKSVTHDWRESAEVAADAGAEKAANVVGI
jgi:hypothetical protein